MEDSTQFASTFDGLMKLVGRLRGPNGCPWDREQTPQSMKRYLLEECYELLDAIDEGDPGNLADELGDVMFHLAFQVQLGIERGELAEAQVFQSVIEKLIRRHPHVFGQDTATDARQVEAKWHSIKSAERADDEASVLDGVPEALPALAYAQTLQERAARSGFDWEDVEGVVEKVAEELGELREAKHSAEKEAELGDLLFSIVNVGRWMELDAEGALRKADARFRKRFALMEVASAQRGVAFEGLSMDEKEALWQEAKSLAE